jgi:repressor LexA
LIQSYQRDHGYSPTYAELAKDLNVSTITVFEHLEALERKGAITRRRHEARSVEISDPNFMPELTAQRTLQVKGVIAAGSPIEAIITEPPEALPIADLFGCQPTGFALRVRGDSMVADHICDGDYIVVEQRDTARDGEIVVALDENNQATLKRFYREGGRIRLQPSNPTMPPIYADNIRIQGVLKGVVRRVR